MNYRATCPQCASVFQLDDDQLAAAQGWAQCGVCGAAFDTRPSLALADGSPLPLAEAAATPTTVAQPDAGDAPPAADPGDQPAAEPTPLPTVATGEDPAADAATAIPAPRGIAERDSPAELPSIILIDPDQPLPDDAEPLPQIPPHADSLPPLPARFAARPPAAAAPAPAARVEYAQPRPAGAAAHGTRPSAVRRRARPWLWALASLVMLILLTAQLAYFLRDTVVSQWPQSRPAFEALCAQAGCTLSLPRNLEALQIVGSDLRTEARDRLRLTLTLGNRAAAAQAWPVLVLTLTDQRNRPLARRSFAPSEYLDDPRRIESGIPPRSEQPLSLALTVRDLAPMGFGLSLRY